MKNYSFLRLLPFVFGLGLSPQIRAQDLGSAIVIPSGGEAVQIKPPAAGPIKPVPRSEIRTRKMQRQMEMGANSKTRVVGQTCSGDMRDARMALSDCRAPYRDGAMKPEPQGTLPSEAAFPFTPIPESVTGR